MEREARARRSHHVSMRGASCGCERARPPNTAPALGLGPASWPGGRCPRHSPAPAGRAEGAPGVACPAASVSPTHTSAPKPSPPHTRSPSNTKKTHPSARSPRPGAGRAGRAGRAWGAGAVGGGKAGRVRRGPGRRAPAHSSVAGAGALAPPLSSYLRVLLLAGPLGRWRPGRRRRLLRLRVGGGRLLVVRGGGPLGEAVWRERGRA